VSYISLVINPCTYTLVILGRETFYIIIYLCLCWLCEYIYLFKYRKVYDYIDALLKGRVFEHWIPPILMEEDTQLGWKQPKIFWNLPPEKSCVNVQMLFIWNTFKFIKGMRSSITNWNWKTITSNWSVKFTATIIW
jgi:hypothetical protein